MKFYLSSYGLGNETNRLNELVPKDNKETAYISNAIDFATDLERRKKNEKIDIDALTNLGLEVEQLDLRDYFGRQHELKTQIAKFGLIWISGGSAFVLRQAMKQSGLDHILKDLFSRNADIVYGGYSAGACVLGPTLRGLEFYGLESAFLGKDPNFKRYANVETIWEGLGLLEYSIVPHYKSDHPESKDSDKVIGYMIENKMPFKALKDGEVIIIE